MARMLARLGRAFLVGALLVAQQAALAHDLWHASGAPSAQGSKAPGGKPSKLCDLHDLLGTVLGVAGGAAPQPALLALGEPGFVAPPAAVGEAELLAPHSRDPPLIS
jgi:hypothetical protein